MDAEASEHKYVRGYHPKDGHGYWLVSLREGRRGAYELREQRHHHPLKHAFARQLNNFILGGGFVGPDWQQELRLRKGGGASFG